MITKKKRKVGFDLRIPTKRKKKGKEEREGEREKEEGVGRR